MKKFGLLGEKLGHSYSKIIHEYVFKQKQMDHTYELIEVEKEQLKDTIELLKNDTFSGYNVTIPYKKEVMQYLDFIDPSALSIGSVNTIIFEDGLLKGYNTDYYGFINELKYYNIEVLNKDCYVLGTGGSSLAIKKGLADLGGNVYSVSRTKDETTITYEELTDKKIDLLVNTTPIGMYPNVDESPIDIDIASKCGYICDIIYNPKLTKLMSYNKNSYNGLLMLIGQALKADEFFLRTKDINIDKEDIMKYVSEVIGLE